MGGLLWNLGRVDAQRYERIKNTIQPYLERKFGSLYRIPRSYGSKPDFGDLDVLVSSQAIPLTWQQTTREIVQELAVVQSKSVGKVFSTNFMDFQVDYFLVSPAHFESTYNFMCFNDLGNLLGKMFHRFNLKYGEEGLAYVYRRADGHYKVDLPVSTDMEKILTFIGLDYGHWRDGFATLEEMFAWVVQSPYFSVRPYLAPSASTQKRVQHRKTIQAFVTWLAENQISAHYAALENREAYLPWIQDFFPESDLLNQVARERENEARATELRSKFNGNLVKELTQLEGQALGAFIAHFKATFADFDDFLINNDWATIQQAIVRFFLHWKDH